MNQRDEADGKMLVKSKHWKVRTFESKGVEELFIGVGFKIHLNL